MTEEERIMKEFAILEQAFNESKIKECFYFDHSNCDKGIINAHSIQKNKILKHIAKDGMVIAIKKNIEPFNKIQPLGKKVASTFTGFCGYHDNALFMPIEDKQYLGTLQQKFLFAYRAFAYEAHKKMEMNKMMKLFSEKVGRRVVNQGIANNLDVDTPYVNELFKKCFLSDNYTDLITYDFTLDYEVGFTISTILSPRYDLSGKKINDFKNIKKPIHNMFLTIFPDNGKTYLLFSWFKESDSVYKKWIYQFKSLTTDKQLSFLNVFIPMESENFYINPDLWDEFGEDGRMEFQQYFEFIPFMAVPQRPDDYVPYYDLFKKIEEKK